MGWKKPSTMSLFPFAVMISALLAIPAFSGGRPPLQAQSQAAAGPVERVMGAVAAINGDDLTLKTASGSEIRVAIQDSTRMLRIQPGQKSLKGATSLSLKDLQVGDRVLAIGKSSGSGQPMIASSIIAIKKSDIAQRQQQEEEEWQTHGVGGLVKSTDASAGTIILMPNAAGKTVTVHTSTSTIFRRYAPGSVQFQDAKPGAFAQIEPGDQLRARGTLSPNGNEITAAAVVSGSFENIAGIITSVRPNENEVTVKNLVTKQPVTVEIVPASELRKLPAEAAQEIAARLAREREAASSAGKGKQGPTLAAPASETEQSKTGGADLDQILRGLPQIGVRELHKGDAVMIVSNQGAEPSAPVTAIKLVSGVEPLLRAASGKGQGKALQSLWSGFSAGGGGGQASEGSGSPAPSSQNR